MPKITSVRSIGERQTYNLTMKSQYHNYILSSGLISANSHSAGYGKLSYQTAYLKAHYPVEFVAALLTVEREDSDKLAIYAKSAEEIGVEVLPPDINESYGDFTPVEGAVRWGLYGIKNVSSAVVDSIIEEREKKPFKNFQDFCFRTKGALNKRSIEYLIKAGCFEGMADKKALLDGLEEFLDWAKIEVEENEEVLIHPADLPMPVLRNPEPNKVEDLLLEKEAIGMFIRHHPCEYLKGIIESRTTSMDKLIKGTHVISGVIESKKNRATRKGNPMTIFTASDEKGSIEGVVYSDMYSKFSEVQENEPIVALVEVSESWGGSRIVLKNFIPWSKRHLVGKGLVPIEDIDDIEKYKEAQAEDGVPVTFLIGNKWAYDTDIKVDRSILKDAFWIINVSQFIDSKESLW